MSIVNTFEYRYLFDDERPDAREILKDIPSKYVIAIMSIINNTLSIDGQKPQTQKALLYRLTHNFSENSKQEIYRRAIPKIDLGFDLFTFPYSVEVVNRELINFREDNVEMDDNFEMHEFNIFKAYVVVCDEMVKKDELILNNAQAEGFNNTDDMLKALWPHLIKQFEFTNRPDPIFETFKGRALMSYIQRHPKFCQFAEPFFRTLNCKTGQEYIGKIFSLIQTNLKQNESADPTDYLLRIKAETVEPILEALAVSPREIKNNIEKQIDYRGLKEKPLFEFTDTEFIVPYWDFFTNAVSTGTLFSFFQNSGIKEVFQKPPVEFVQDSDSGMAKFKGILGKEFSEGILFSNTMKKCFSRRHECLKFFNDDEAFNPDCYYRRGNDIFIIEFKDYLLSSDVIQSGSFEKIKEAIDAKFVSYTLENKGKVKTKNKGIYQISKNIELLATEKNLFWDIDEMAKNKKLKLKNMTIHPIIIQTNIYFDLPGISDYLSKLIQDKLVSTKPTFKHIAPFTSIYFKYFFYRLLLFSDEKIQLRDELRFFHSSMKTQKERAKRTHKPEDWFHSLFPFSLIDSPLSSGNINYRRRNLAAAIKECWKIDD